MLRRRFIPITRNVSPIVAPQLPSANRVLVHDKFTLLSYNILSPCYMWPQVYTYVPDKYKDWNYRHELLEYELLNIYKADIMCIQEMTNKDYSGFWKDITKEKYHMGSQYISKTKPKYWDRGPEDLDGVGIFYNLDMFEYISSKGIYLNQLLDVFTTRELGYLSKKELTLTDGAGNPTGVSNLLDTLRNKNQVSLFVSLRHRESNTIFIVVNTHLYWKYDEVKLSQCMIIMRELSKIIDDLLVDVKGITHDKVKILFTGDLNSQRNSLVMNFLKGQILNNKSLNMINPMKPYLNRCLYDDIPEGLFEHTCYSGKLKGIFDYVWYHDTDLSLTKILTGKEVSQELVKLNQYGLPNANHPSDHIPLLAEFQIL